MKQHSHSEMATNILKFLLIGGFVATCFVLPNFAQVYRLFKPKNALDRQRVKRSLTRLKRHKFIEIIKRDGEEVVRLTMDGEKKALHYRLSDLKLKIPKKWDGLWTVAIFDIPEMRRAARCALTDSLNEIGFYHLQKSTFIAPCECHKEINMLGNLFEVREHIITMRVKEIENGKKLLKHFGLDGI
jgi:DNA-binding transcriptional regulator PaaX